MNVYYMVDDVIQQYGPEKFYESIRDNVCDVISRSCLEVDDFSVAELYRGFAFAWIVATKSRNPALLHELLLETTFDTSTEDELEIVTFLNTVGETEQHYAAIAVATELFQKELNDSTGVTALIESLLPGKFINYYGEDYDNLVLVCEVAEDAIFGIGRFLQ